MIDLMKRLAELDAQNPNIVKEGSVAECGMMPEMGMMGGMDQHHNPASINMTADSGEELSGMLKDIMSLAGMQKPDASPDEMPLSIEPAVQTLEPAGPPDATSTMRSVIDKLNPMDGDGEDGVDQAHGDVDDDGDHDMNDHDLETDQETDEEYDNTPADPNKKPEFDADQYAYQPNQPNQGDRMDGTSPKAYADMNEAVADLFAQYKDFVSESKPSAGMTAKEKSSVVKKAKAGKDIGKSGKGFEKVEKAAAKGGAKNPKAVAAAAMWKQQAKK